MKRKIYVKQGAKFNWFLLACLFLTGGYGNAYAQRPEAESADFLLESVDFRLDGAPASGLKTAASADSLIPWSLPDTVRASKTTGEYAMYIYTYDDRGNAVQTEALQYVGSVWFPSQRIDAHFNRFDLIDTTTSYLYQNGDYMPNARKISAYDRQGRHTMLLNATYNIGLQTWQMASRYTYTYTAEGRLASAMQEAPDLQSTGWKKVAKTEYTYDTEGRELSFEMSVWAGEWQPYRAYYRTYENGRIVKELGRMQNELTGRYGDTYRYEYTYNDLNSLTDFLVFNTDSTGKWDTNLHRTYVYNAQNLVSEEFTQVLDEAIGGMENATREYYFYDADGLKDSVSHEVWLSLEWVHTVSYRYFYNEAGVRDGWIYYNLAEDTRRTDKYELDFDENGDGTLAQCFTLQGEDWVPADRYDLEVYRHDGELVLRANAPPLCAIRVHYAAGSKTPGPLPDTTTANDALRSALASEVSVYPNPVSETLYVDLSGEGVYDLSLTTLNGVPVSACRMSAGQTAIDVRPYTGLHLLHIVKNGTRVVKKIILL